MPPRIVVDTNVFIAAILSPAGENRDVVRACLRGRARPIMGAALFHEYEDLLGRCQLMAKSPLTATERQSFSTHSFRSRIGSKSISYGDPICRTKRTTT